MTIVDPQVEKFMAWAEANLQVVDRGRTEWRCFCNNPNHDDGTPSMDFNIEKGVYFCRSCGWSGKARIGSVINQRDTPLQEEAVDVITQLNKLQRQAGKPVLPNYLPNDYLAQYKFPAFWAQDRGFTDETISAFELGYDPMKNAGTIPVRNMNGKLLGVTMRFLGDDVEKRDRYKYPFGFVKSHHIFGSHLIMESPLDYVVLTEGYLDAAMTWQAGYQAGGIGGSHPSAEQIRVLLRLGITRVIFAFDNDREGRMITNRCLGKWTVKGRRGKPVTQYRRETDFGQHFHCQKIIWKPFDKKDPGETSKRRLRYLIDNAVDIVK